MIDDSLLDHCVTELLKHLSLEDSQDANDRIRGELAGGIYPLPRSRAADLQNIVHGQQPEDMIKALSMQGIARPTIVTKSISQPKEPVMLMIERLHECLSEAQTLCERDDIVGLLGTFIAVEYDEDAKNRLKSGIASLIDMKMLVSSFCNINKSKGRPSVKELKDFAVRMAYVYQDLTGKPFTALSHREEKGSRKSSPTPVSRGQQFIKIATGYLNDLGAIRGIECLYTEKNIDTACRHAVKTIRHSLKAVSD